MLSDLLLSLTDTTTAQHTFLLLCMYTLWLISHSESRWEIYISTWSIYKVYNVHSITATFICCTRPDRKLAKKELKVKYMKACDNMPAWLRSLLCFWDKLNVNVIDLNYSYAGNFSFNLVLVIFVDFNYFGNNCTCSW